MFSRLKKSLDTIVSSAFILVFSAVLAIGGTSFLLVQRMMDKTYAIAEETRHVDFINNLHNKTFNLISAIYKQTIHGNDEYAQQTFRLANEIDQDIDTYIQKEEESAYPESEEELRLMIGLRCNLQALQQSSQSPRTPQGLDPLAYWEKMASRHASDIQAQVHRINQLHFDIIARKVEKNRESMSLVLSLYVLTSLAVLALVYSSYRLHSRHVVKPLKHLAEATERVAQGDLSVRVESASETEIGRLYKAFNSMTARLQCHEEELITFNRELERKVQERTRTLEETCHSLQDTQARLMHYEKMAMLGQIATGVNHEVRTPLNALYMNVQLIRKTLEHGSEGINNERRLRQKDILDRIALVEQEVLRISDMLEEFVRYARFPPLRKKEIDLYQVIEYVADMLSERADQARVSLNLSRTGADCHLMADQDKLIQALVNLCINAIYAMPEGGMLTLATVVRDEVVEISVADTGTGIPEENMDKIFQPFFTSKASGLGFGLPTVQRIVEEHDGKITCQSRVGEGTVFNIQLPVMRMATQGSPG
jgi:signal transduction histidine kinase